MVYLQNTMYPWKMMSMVCMCIHVYKLHKDTVISHCKTLNGRYSTIVYKS